MTRIDAGFRGIQRATAALILAIVAAGSLIVATPSSAGAASCAHPARFGANLAFDTDLVRLDGSFADFGDCGHWGGRPTGHAVVNWIDGRHTSSRRMMAEVYGRVYLDPNAFQGGCARVRVRFFDADGGVMQSHYSEPLCGGPIFNRNGVFSTYLQSDNITRVQICTQYQFVSWSTTACANRHRGD